MTMTNFITGISNAAAIQHCARRVNTATVIAVLVSALLSNTSFAQYSQQQPTQQQWYQVELFIFANISPTAAGAEQWPEDLGLKYPDNIVVLREDAAEQVETLLSDGSTATGTRQTRVANTMRGSQRATANSIRPFMLLDPSQHQLTTAVNKITAQQDFKPLFHGAWRQQIGKRTKSASLLIRGGDAYDDHFELEGSINLSVERYLHINTDLWLSKFVRNSDGDQPLWPVLPRVPVITQAANTSTGLFASKLKPSLSFKGGADNTSSLGTSLQQSLENSFDIPLQDLRDKQYSVQQTVAMRQHRRMRSNELHYIDHPMLGLLIKIVPYDLSQDETASTR